MEGDDTREPDSLWITVNERYENIASGSQTRSKSYESNNKRKHVPTDNPPLHNLSTQPQKTEKGPNGQSTLAQPKGCAAQGFLLFFRYNTILKFMNIK